MSHNKSNIFNFDLEMFKKKGFVELNISGGYGVDYKNTLKEYDGKINNNEIRVNHHLDSNTISAYIHIKIEKTSNSNYSKNYYEKLKGNDYKTITESLEKLINRL